MTVQRGEFCPTCERYNSRHVVVNGMVLNEKGQILLIKRGIEPGYGNWALPGGYLDWDESLEEGVIREVREETGIETEVVKMMGPYDSIKRNYQNIAMVYVLRLVGNQTLRPQPEEILDVNWFDFDSLPEPIGFDHNIMLADYQKPQ